MTEEGGWEEFFDYVFPEDAKDTQKLKILEIAKKWKKEVH